MTLYGNVAIQDIDQILRNLGKLCFSLISSTKKISVELEKKSGEDTPYPRAFLNKTKWFRTLSEQRLEWLFNEVAMRHHNL